MIIDFTVSNFRSIKDEQTFSMYVQTKGEHLLKNVSYPANDKIGILKTTGLYGSNASGKSNLLKAFYALQCIITQSGDLKDGDIIPCYEPYLLEEETKSLPTRFEIEFFISATEKHEEIKISRYRYSVAFTENKIIEEKLIFYPSTQQAVIFDRGIDDTWQSINFGSLYKGGKKRLSFFANNAYLSKAGDSADAPPMVRNIYNYFRKNITHLAINEVAHKFHWLNNTKLVNNVGTLLSLVDTGIHKIEVQERTVPHDDIINSLLDNVPDSIKQHLLNELKLEPIFLHKSNIGRSIPFKERDESDGTRKLFHLAPLIFETLSSGGVLIMDELDNSMHPFMAELIIKLFNDPRVNKNNAQLIFSTHNVNLMSPELLRRDQIFLVEKQKGATKFYSLNDFDKKKVKPQSPFNQWYTEGRFGAIPFINYQEIVGLFNSHNHSHAEKEN